MASKQIQGNDKKIITFGRHTYSDGFPAFDWPNSGFCFTFEGNAVILSFAAFKEPYTLYVRVNVDNRSQRFALSTGNEKIIIEGLSNRTHKVELIKVSESFERVVFTGAEIFGAEPALLPTERKTGLKVEFLGDSLTAGYGNLAPASEKLFYTFQQDSTRAYAYLCASILGADAHYECISGKGVYFNCNGVKDYEIPTFFTHASRETREEWDFSLWTPDVVVINAGTNDYCGKVDDETFIKAAVDFLGLVRSKYPKALIIWAYGMTQTVARASIKKAVERFDDNNTRFLKLNSMYRYKDEIGGNGHPNEKAHRRVAKTVARFIQQEIKSASN